MHKYSASALKALDASIAHWNRLATNTATIGERPSAHHCALCQKFNKSDGACKGCPVVHKTGQPYCRSTPYTDARIEYDWAGESSESFLAAALVMHDWLVALKKEISQ